MARERPGESPRTSLLARRTRHEEDDRLLAIIDGLPMAPGRTRHAIAGICNAEGQVYRRVELFSALELIMLAARLNAIGFEQESGTRAGKYAYDVVFRKVPRRRAGNAVVS